jgi:hypothetical protein
MYSYIIANILNKGLKSYLKSDHHELLLVQLSFHHLVLDLGESMEILLISSG